jgi:hypothetical protein
MRALPAIFASALMASASGLALSSPVSPIAASPIEEGSPSPAAIPQQAAMMVADWFGANGDSRASRPRGKYGMSLSTYNGNTTRTIRSSNVPSGHTRCFTGLSTGAAMKATSTDIPNLALPDTGPFNIEINWRPEAVGSHFVFCEMDASDPHRWRLVQTVSATAASNTLIFATWNGSSWVNRITHNYGVVQTNVWSHIAVSRDNAGNTRLFVNGVMVGSNSSITLPTRSGATAFQAAGYYSTNPAHAWTNFRYWNTYCLYNDDAGFTAPAAALAYDYTDANGDPYWDDVIFLCSGDFDEIHNYGAITKEARGPVTSSGTGTNVANGQFSRNRADGINTNPLAGKLYDGTPNNDTVFGLGTGSYTAEMWIRTPANGSSSSTGNSGGFGRYVTGTNDRSWWLGLERSTTAPLFFAKALASVDGSTALSLIGSATLAQATWYHLAVCYNASTGVARLFVDGVMVDKQTWTAGGVYATSVPLRTAVYNATNTCINARYNDYRLTAAARYDSDSSFAVPTGPYPDYPQSLGSP